MAVSTTNGTWISNPEDPIDFRQILNHTHNVIDILPQGAIMWFYLPTAPDGWVICNGNWYSANGKQTSETQTSTCNIKTPNLIGRYALGANENIGNNVEAGLPNITGKYAVQNNGGSEGSYFNGAFYAEYNLKNGGGWNDGGYKSGLGFDASKSNPIYGRSNTVTPPSVKLLPCMKL